MPVLNEVVGKLRFEHEFIPNHVYKAWCQCGMPTLISKDEWGKVHGCELCEIRRHMDDVRVARQLRKEA